MPTEDHMKPHETTWNIMKYHEIRLNLLPSAKHNINNIEQFVTTQNNSGIPRHLRRTRWCQCQGSVDPRLWPQHGLRTVLSSGRGQGVPNQWCLPRCTATHLRHLVEILGDLFGKRFSETYSNSSNNSLSRALLHLLSLNIHCIVKLNWSGDT